MTTSNRRNPCAAISVSALSSGSNLNPSVEQPMSINSSPFVSNWWTPPCASVGTGCRLIAWHEDDLPRLTAGKEVIGSRRVVEMEAMGNQRTDAEPLTIKVDKRVVVPVDEIPNAICRDFLLQELPPGIDSRLAPCTSEDETTLLADRVERQIDAGVGSACVDAEFDATTVCKVADRGQGIGGSRVDN